MNAPDSPGRGAGLRAHDPGAPGGGAGLDAPGPDSDPPVTVLVVDDDELTRTGLRTLLSAAPGLHVAGEAADGAEVAAAVHRLRPDVVLMDVRMPRMDGIEATRRLRALPDPPKVVVITTFEHDAYVWDALRAGASGFIRKRAPARQIAHAIRLVAAGDSVLFPEAVRRLAAERPPRSDTSVTAALTGRETETLRLMARGLSNQDIAARLVVSLETVKTHVGNVLAKLGVGNRTQAVVLAFETGVADPWARDPSAGDPPSRDPRAGDPRAGDPGASGL